MAYCPSCGSELLASDPRCLKCGADFTAATGWKPLETRLDKEPEGRSLRWWQKIAWFLGFWIITVQVWKLFGADALTQILFGIIFGIFGVVWMNARAIKRSKMNTAAQAKEPSAS